MKKTLTLLVASTALTAAIGVPAWSAMHVPESEGLRSLAALFEEGHQELPLVLVSGDDDDDDDDDRDDDDDDDDEEDDDDDDRGGARNPAPAGTVAPPQNGLFGTGTPPQVKVN
jgi:hypothetical protein